MNTIPGKIRIFLKDVLITLRTILRKRKHLVNKPENQFESLKADYDTLESLTYFILGTSIDGILDIFYEFDVPNNSINPLISYFFALGVYVIPTVFIFAEIIGSVPGRATLYSYAYSGFSEGYAFMCGWIWLGAAAARVALCLHYFTLSMLSGYESLLNLDIATNVLATFFYMVFPFVSREMAVNLNYIGCIMRVVQVFFLAPYTKPENWFLNASPIDSYGLIKSTLTYCQLFFSLPMVIIALQNSTRTRLLIKKMIALIFCGILIHLSFFLVLIGNVPYTMQTKPWVATLIGKYRSYPYLMIFTVNSFWCKFCGILAILHGSSILMYQMSLDGLLFRFLSFSETLRKIVFCLCSSIIFFNGFNKSRLMYEALSSLGVMLAAMCLLICRSLGQRGFYVRHGAVPTNVKKVKNIILMRLVTKCMLGVVALGSLVGCGVIHDVLIGTFVNNKVKFISFTTAVGFFAVALLFVAADHKHKSVSAVIRCPLSPFLPAYIFFISNINVAIAFPQIAILVILCVLGGMLFYLIFGIKNVTVNVLVDAEEKPSRACHEGAFEDDKVYNLLHDAFDKYNEYEDERDRELEMIRAPPLCYNINMKYASKKASVKSNVKIIKMHSSPHKSSL